MSEDNHHRTIHPVVILITHLIVFIVGLYISRGGVPYVRIVRCYHENQITSTESVQTNSVNISSEVSFFDIGMKFKTDKVSLHHYETMYEKYLRKYIGTNVSILEIGLGCGMSYGPGASAYLWRHYLGPQANIHFLEYDQNCGREWHKTHGEKVNNLSLGKKFDLVFF